MFPASPVLPNRKAWTEESSGDTAAGSPLPVSRLGNSVSEAVGLIESRRVCFDFVDSFGGVRQDCCFSLGVVGGLSDVLRLNTSSCCSRRLMLRPTELVMNGV